MDFIILLVFKVFIFIFRFLPFRALYAFAGVISWFLNHVVGYRKKAIIQNLKNSFPDFPEKKIYQIKDVFYQHLGDMLIESLKAFTMTEEAVVKRYRFLNAEILREFYTQGQSVICVAGHYGNWEWGGVASGTQLIHKPVGFYKPLSNKHMDDLVKQTRVKGRSILASITETAETFRKDYGEPAIFYMVADQSPSSARLAYWIRFLNQDTAALHGPEKYARLYNLPVVFAAANKIRRGYYEVTFSVVEADPSKTKTGEITRRFMQKLEDVVVARPEYYLWSHRRWKLKKPAD
jgi:KDO2-lipid IV(A) lauroyltransferase